MVGVDGSLARRMSPLFDERQVAVKAMIEMPTEKAYARSLPVDICVRGPSDHPDFAAFLVEAGIDAILVLPDSAAQTIQAVAQVEPYSIVPSE